jgi:hypothetical protein
MVRDSGRKRLPPYVSYRTFLNFIDRLQQGIPSRIDRSYWSDRLSGSTGTQLMSALRFLGLIDVSGAPTGKLRQLVSAKGTQKSDIFRQITSEAFGFLLQESFDAQTATYAQLEEVFQRTFELADSVSRKCVKFFVALASDAGIPLSPFITKRVRSVRGSTGTKPVIKRRGTKTKWNLIVPQDLEKIPDEISWDKMLLTKFPTFDPTWSDEVKLGWLEAFDGLKLPTFDPAWSDEVKLKWFDAFDKLLERDFPKSNKQ